MQNECWSYSVMVITKDFESFDPGSSPGRTCVPVAQLDKASDYESEDWGFESLQGYFSSPFQRVARTRDTQKQARMPAPVV